MNTHAIEWDHLNGIGDFSFQAICKLSTASRFFKQALSASYHDHCIHSLQWERYMLCFGVETKKHWQEPAEEAMFRTQVVLSCRNTQCSCTKPTCNRLNCFTKLVDSVYERLYELWTGLHGHLLAKTNKIQLNSVIQLYWPIRWATWRSGYRVWFVFGDCLIGVSSNHIKDSRCFLEYKTLRSLHSIS